MKIGIVGLPNVGKSTLFQALTKKEVDRSNYPFATIDPNVGVVEVPDRRLGILAKLSNSKKIVPAVVEFVDIAGLVKGAAEGEGLGNKFLSHIKEVNAIVEVVRAFEDSQITHVEGAPNPKRDIEILETELLLKDLETAEKALPRFEKEAKIGDKKALEKFELLKKIIIELKSGAPVGLLSSKPVLYCFNARGGEEKLKELKPEAVILNLKEELEAGLLSEEEKKELGIKSGLEELIKAAYRILGLITFLTTGEDETRAWTVPAGSTAPRAGRAIHGDFEKKFIRAEVIAFEKLIEAGSLAKARELGQVRTEGKNYIVKEGDVVEFKI
ncbi:MAG: redox-regulated ATPase YchF [bacterium]|nr:redox-regulated ATPase YchF [bacterium]